MNVAIGALVLVCTLVGAVRIVRVVLASARSLPRAVACRLGRALWRWGNR